MPKRLIPFAIAYDFDGTLAPGNMQEYDFIPDLDMTKTEFWREVKQKARDHDADEILMYMQTMVERADHKKISIRKTDFQKYGKGIKLFSGVENWFDRIDAYGKTKGVRVEHFIISSGLREMLEGTSIYKKFKKIYASGFVFDHHGIAKWPAVAMNFTTKTQYLFRINKGSLDVHDNEVINKYVPQSERAIPFTNMIFIGDGDTDIPCMRLVKDQGGHSIAVYNPAKRDAKKKALQLVADGRANLIAPATYESGETIDQAVRAIIDKVEAISRIG